MLLPATSEVLRGNLFTGGGAIGMAFARPTDQWRAEFEARIYEPFRSWR